MRAAFLSATGRMGGAERALLDLLASLRAAEPAWELHLVCGGAGPLAAHAEALGVTVHALPLPPSLERAGDAGASGGASPVALVPALAAAAPGAAAWAWRLGALLRRIAPHVVHTNGFKAHVLGALALPRGSRLVWHVHDFVSTRRVMSGLMRRAAPRCAAAVCVSRAVADDLRAACGPRLRTEVVHNAVDLARFSPDGPRLDLDALSGLAPAADGAVRIGLVATMGLWKGHATFLRALGSIGIDGDAVRGYVVGGGIYATAGSEVDAGELRRLAGELGVQAGFTGYVDDPAAAMRALDVVVHASTQPEPFGLVIAEGMACGRAVVVSAAGGAAEIASDGVDALTVPPGDVPALAAALRRLAGDAELRARLGAAARARAGRDFDRARLGPQVAAIYRSVTGEG